MPAIAYPHIEVRDDGLTYIAGTRLKVIHVIADHLHWHWDAEAIRRQYAQLSLGQVHGALSYYYDHQDEMNRLLDERGKLEERLISELGVPPLQQRVGALKRSLERSP